MPIHISLARFGLSDHVRRFVLEYVIDFDGTAAAARAGYTRRCAAQWAAMTLRRSEVQAAIRAELAQRENRLRLTAERITEEVMRIAFCDPARIARWTPEGITLRHSDDLSADDRAAVKRIHLGPPLGKGRHKRAQLVEMHDSSARLLRVSAVPGCSSPRTFR